MIFSINGNVFFSILLLELLFFGFGIIFCADMEHSQVQFIVSRIQNAQTYSQALGLEPCEDWAKKEEAYRLILHQMSSGQENDFSQELSKRCDDALQKLSSLRDQDQPKLFPAVVLLSSIGFSLYLIPKLIRLSSHKFAKFNYLRKHKSNFERLENEPEKAIVEYAPILNLYQTSFFLHESLFVLAEKKFKSASNKENIEELLKCTENVLFECEKIFKELGFSAKKRLYFVYFVLDETILRLKKALTYFTALVPEKENNGKSNDEQFVNSLANSISTTLQLIVALNTLKKTYPSMIQYQQQLKKLQARNRSRKIVLFCVGVVLLFVFSEFC